MSAAANFGGFDTLLGGYQDYLALYAQARGLFIRDRLSYKPVLGVPPFAQGPGDIAVFSAIYEIIRKLNHMLLVGRIPHPGEVRYILHSQRFHGGRSWNRTHYDRG